MNINNAADNLCVVGGRAITQTAHGFSIGNVLYLNGTTYTLAQANNAAAAEVAGIVTSVPDANTFIFQFNGWVQGLSGLTAGMLYYLNPAVAGSLTATQPIAPGQVIKPLMIADTTTSGYWINMIGMII